MAKTKATKGREPSFEELANFKPAFDQATMYELEEAAQGFGLKRRVTLAVLTKSADELSEWSRTAQESYAEARAAVESFKTHAEGVYETARAAALRILVADVAGPPISNKRGKAKGKSVAQKGATA